jgi:hypothetical protein
MTIERQWAMPNRWTFKIPPIINLLLEEVPSRKNVIDPFAGENGSSYAEYVNDIEKGGVDALEFLRTFGDNFAEVIIYDPPYSITQSCKYGKKEFSSMKYWADCKNEIARILKPSGKAICFGWSSMGLGKNRGFEMTRILLVPHGGSRNDTIVTVETKI